MVGGRRALLPRPGAATNENFDSGQQAFNVMHGTAPAQGDGRADDDGAINHWLGRAAALGGHRVLVPPGRYQLRRPLDVGSGVTLYGVGAPSVLVAADGFAGPLVRIADGTTDAGVTQLVLDGAGVAGPLIEIGDGCRHITVDPTLTNWAGDEPVTVGSGVAWLERGPQLTFDARAYGLIGDGTSHPLSEGYTTLAAAQADYGAATDLAQEADWAACTHALAAAAAAGGRVIIPASLPYFGTDTLLVDASNVGIEGAGPRATVIQYRGTGAAIWVQSGQGLPAIQVRLAHFGVDGGATAASPVGGAYGIKLGHDTVGVSYVSAALGLFEQVRVTGCTVAGWWIKAAQECLFLGCHAQDNTGDGLLLDHSLDVDPPKTNSNTAGTWIGGGLRFNGGRGAFIRQQAGWSFTNRCVIEGNGLEGILYERPDTDAYLPDHPTAANVTTMLLVLDDAWFEQNNYGRVEAQANHQVVIRSAGPSLVQNTVFRRCYFGVPRAPALPLPPDPQAIHADNGHIYLEEGQLDLEYCQFAGAPANKSVVVANSASCQLNVTDDGTPDTQYALGALAKFSAMIARSGTRSVWANVAGTPTKVFEAGEGAKLGFFATTPVVRPSLTGNPGVAAADALSALGLASYAGLADGAAVLGQLQAPIGLEDFRGGTATSGAIGEWGWTLAHQQGSGGTVTAAATAANHHGEIDLHTNTTAGGATPVISSRSLGVLDCASGKGEMWVLMKPSQADTDTLIRAGGTGTPTSLAPTEGAYFEKLPADTNWWGVCRHTGGTPETRVEFSAVNTGTVAQPVTTSYILGRIRRLASGSFEFTLGTLAQFVAGSGTTTVTVGATGTVPAGGNTLAPFFAIGNNGTTTDKVLKVDAFVLVGLALART